MSAKASHAGHWRRARPAAWWPRSASRRRRRHWGPRGRGERLGRHEQRGSTLISLYLERRAPAPGPAHRGAVEKHMMTALKHLLNRLA